MILILNGSPNGRKSNGQKLIEHLRTELKYKSVKIITLSENKWTQQETKKLFADIEKARGFIFVSGTYWDSWGSPLQSFLEHTTPLEGTPAFLGKPAAVFVLNHSVGGKGVLSRLQGVLCTLGCLIPPMSGMVYAWSSHTLLKNKRAVEAKKDLWSLADSATIIENFCKALQINIQWDTWAVDAKDYKNVWIRS